MNGLNDAFERLREVVPNLTTEQKMSKIETLHMAQTYIKALAGLIEREERKEMLGVVDLDDGHPHHHHHHHQQHIGVDGDGAAGAAEFHDIKMEPAAPPDLLSTCCPENSGNSSGQR
jgi:hypothetical protein